MEVGIMLTPKEARDVAYILQRKPDEAETALPQS
jgi:hypothetical protein